jgi:cytochrome c oxidase subunit II
MSARLRFAWARGVSGIVLPSLGLPKDVSENGWRIDWLMNCTHVFTALLFVVMCSWMAIACFKYGKRHSARYDHGNSRRSVVIALVLSLFIFALVDGNLFVNTLSDLDNVFWNFDIPKKDPRTIKIEINAHQWAWDVRYAGPDGKFGTADDVVTWNEVKVPSGVPVYLQLTSTDVIHSFYLPNFRLKQDVVPGQVNRLWFQAKAAATGQFDIGCAQHCGTHHYKMRGELTLLSDGDFRRWLAVQSDNAKRAYDPGDSAAHWGWDWKDM